MDSPAGPFVFSRGGPDILDVTVTYARDSFCGFTGWAFVLSRGGPDILAPVLHSGGGAGLIQSHPACTTTKQQWRS